MAKSLRVPFYVTDFSKLSEVSVLAARLKGLGQIDVLANNAGGIMGNREVTEDGFEKTFQVNHLAPFLLTRLLLPDLITSRAKVIQTASAAANMWGADFDVTDLNNERDYAPEHAYGCAKLENILFTRELQRRFGGSDISAVAFHPGVVRSAFASDTTHFMKSIYHSPLKYLFTISSEKSAKRLVRLVEGRPGADWKTGEVYDDRKPMPVKFQDDGSVAKSLWDKSEDMVRKWVK
ncbi:SDR family NAD(P)-dependent oxidoreductase [Asticcacaulis sp.]|uniref:SDR family NAD(P)-dependent oxidoreductase n=1 Tax=Asticcacaulis sp. TaxID=1872648 RepID=UPI0025B9D7DC|nr:SDR family NAD(P)-dependent oxidoreductase [Asticcacaulis sp.]